MPRTKRHENPVDALLNPEHLSQRCGAKLRGKEATCQRWAAVGHTRCRLHGGAPGSGRPPTHGRYTQLRQRQLAVMTALLRLLHRLHGHERA